MSESFDPYLKWLGIPAKDRPIDYYRLLAIERFENDPDVITNAADARMAHLKNFSSGQHAEVSQKLLNEISVARVCLLNPDKKVKYDTLLRERRSKLASANVAAGSGGSFFDQLSEPTTARTGASPPPLKHGRKPTPWPVIAVLSGCGVALLAVLLILWATRPEEKSPGLTALHTSGDANTSSGTAVKGGVAADKAGEKKADATKKPAPPAKEPAPKPAAGPAPQTPPPGTGVSPPPAAPTPAAHGMPSAANAILENFKRHAYRFRCLGGPRTIGAGVPVTDVRIDGSSVRMAYSYNNGQLIGTLHDRTLSGNWVQNNARGTVELVFDADFSHATGAWGNEDGRRGGPAFLDMNAGPSAPVEPGNPVASQATPPAATALSEETPAEPTRKPRVPSGAEPAANEAAKLLPEPAAADLTKAEKDVHEVYQASLAKAQTPADKLSLAGDLERDAARTEDNPAARYVMYRLAAEEAVEAGEIGRGLEIIDELGHDFRGNAVAMKTELLVKYSDALTKPKPGAGRPAAKHGNDPAINQQLLDAARVLYRSAMENGELDDASRCLKIALPAARRLHDLKATVAIQNSQKDQARLQERLHPVEEAEKQLAAEPQNAANNGLVGAWYCFAVGKWDKGLPFLAKGDDAEAAAAAKQDLAAPRQAAEQIAVGDRWWNLAEQKSGVEVSRLQNRAAYWYKLALPETTGLGQVRLRKRLDSLGVQTAQYALVFDGQTSYVGIPNSGYNGTLPITIEVIAQPMRNEGQFGVSGEHALIANHNYHGVWLGERWGNWNFQMSYQRGINRGSSQRTVTGRHPVQYGKVVHVAAVYDRDQMMSLFVDGQLESREALGGSYSPVASPFYIGAAPSLSTLDAAANRSDARLTQFFSGQIRAVRICKTALYTQTFHPPTELSANASTVLLFRFGEGHGNQLKDSSGARNVGEVHNAQWVEIKGHDAGGANAAVGRE